MADETAAHPPTLRRSLQVFEDAHTSRSVVGLREAFHDDALVESFSSGGRAVGPDETVSAIEAALKDPFFELGDWSYEEIAPSVAILVTAIRYHVSEFHIRHVTVYRLISGKDGLIWRGKLLRSHAEAVTHYHQHGPGLGMTPPTDD